MGGEQPIETHSRYADIDPTTMAKIKDYVQNPHKGTIGPPYAANVIELYTKLIKGQTSYVAPGTTASKTSYAPASPTVLGNVGKINDPGFVTAPAGQNWILMGHSWEKRGSEWQVTNDWQLSGTSGWDTDLYT